MTEADLSSEAGEQRTGFVKRLRAHTPAVITNNAPRIVAGLKIVADIAMLLSKNKVFSAAGIGFIGASSVTALYGRKKTEEEKERLRAEEEENTQSENKGYLSDFSTKLLHPSKYPIESGTAIAMLSSMFLTASGVFSKGGFSPGRLFGGLISFVADANIVFTKEKIGGQRSNRSSEGSVNYYVTELRNRPVLLSSLLDIGSNVVCLAGGIHEYRKGKEMNTMLAGGILLAANVFQALFVDKNDYNVEPRVSREPVEDTVEGVVQREGQLEQGTERDRGKKAGKWIERAVRGQSAPEHLHALG